jgi:hypothetical protein
LKLHNSRSVTTIGVFLYDPLTKRRPFAPRIVAAILVGRCIRAEDFRVGEFHPERFVKQLPKPPDKPTAVWINPPPIKAGEISLKLNK